jgi:hypothetical protein
MDDIGEGHCRGNPLWLPCVFWAGTGACPYQENDAMNMI